MFSKTLKVPLLSHTEADLIKFDTVLLFSNFLSITIFCLWKEKKAFFTWIWRNVRLNLYEPNYDFRLLNWLIFLQKQIKSLAFVRIKGRPNGTLKTI